MKILFVSGVYLPASGGAEHSMHTLLQELNKAGHTVYVLSGLTPFATTKKDTIDSILINRVVEMKWSKLLKK